jgi:hypothetical protein
MGLSCRQLWSMIGCPQADLTSEIMMLSDKRTLAVALAGALAMAGCGKPPNETQPVADETAAPATANAQLPAPPAEPAPAEPAPSATDTNDTATGAAAFQKRSLASPFAQAELALKESYNRALIAFQIGDYPRAVSELQDLAKTPDLTPEQNRAVQDLLTETLKAAPELAATNSAAAGPGSAKPDAPPVFPLATPDTAQAPKNLPESPFSTADPAVKETFARAKAAYDIGNYDVAAAELRDLVTNAQLNYQQKYAVQALLDKTPQSAPAGPPAQTPKR